MTLIDPEDFRLAKLQELRRLGVDPYGDRFPDAMPVQTLLEDFEGLQGQPVRAAGRITNLRGMGRASFMNIKDRSGRLQLFFQLDRLGEERFHIQSQLEPGDLVGVDGELAKPRTGERTIFVDDFVVLA